MTQSIRSRHPARRALPEPDSRVAEPKETSPEITALTSYIADITAELAALAGKSQLSMLAYFLNLARVEAEIQTRDNGGRQPERRPER